MASRGSSSDAQEPEEDESRHRPERASEAHCLLFGAFSDDACAREKRVTISHASLAPLLLGGALPPSSPLDRPHEGRPPPPPFASAVASCAVAADGFALAAARDGGGLWQWCPCDGPAAAWSRVQVEGLPPDERYAAVAAGDFVCLALSSKDGSVFQWRRGRRRAAAGGDDDGEDDDDDDDGTRNTPASTTPLQATCVLGPRLLEETTITHDRLPIAAIAAGRRHQLAVARPPHAACFAWGDTSRGQCAVSPGQSGAGPSGSWVPRPRLVEALGGIACSLCAAGDAHSLVASADGAAVYGFGGGGADQPELVELSAGDDDNDHAPVVALAAGGKHSVALCADGRVHGWGDASWGQAGAATASGAGSVRAVIAGWRHTVLVLK